MGMEAGDGPKEGGKRGNFWSASGGGRLETANNMSRDGGFPSTHPETRGLWRGPLLSMIQPLLIFFLASDLSSPSHFPSCTTYGFLSALPRASCPYHLLPSIFSSLGLYHLIPHNPVPLSSILSPLPTQSQAHSPSCPGPLRIRITLFLGLPHPVVPRGEASLPKHAHHPGGHQAGPSG